MFVAEFVRQYEKYVSKNGDDYDDDDDEGSSEEDGNTIGRRSSRFSFSLGSLWRTSKKKSMASGWIPADPVELVIFPRELQVAYISVMPPIGKKRRRGHHAPFAIYKARQQSNEEGDEQVHHVTLRLGSDNQLASIYRSKTYQESFDLYQSCIACGQLFYLLDKSDEDASTTIPRLLTQLIQHPLWQAVHVAAALGTIPFFQRLKEEGQFSAINEPSRPEKLYPHMIAIENNNIELTKMLIEMGADLSATDAVGNNAMHFAALASPEMLDELWKHELTHNLVNEVNFDQYAPLLYSIRHANARCTAKLALFGAELKLQAKGGANPLFTAMQSTWNCVDVIKALLESSPGLVDETDPQTGNRAVHAALSKKPLTALLILKGEELDLNAKNAAGQTALHVYTFKGDLGCVMSLASNNADLDAVDDNGDTPLHIAVSSANLMIVRALLCLGANPNIENNAGDSARHLAAKFIGQEREDLVHSLKICGARRCAMGKSDCREGCVYRRPEDQAKISTVSGIDYVDFPTAEDVKAAAVEERLDATPATREAKVHDFMQDTCYADSIDQLMDPEKKKKMINLLSLDGGGIRGLVIIQLLLAIEEALQDRVFDYFDWVAGTSTGSILAAGLAEGKTLRECQQVYLRFKDYIFDTWSRPYNTAALEAFMQKELGADTTLADVPYPRLLITTVIGDIFPIKLKFLRNYELALSKEDKEELEHENPKDWPVWKALRCSSAAPTFFCSVDGKYIDGGLIANNPLSDLLSEIHLFNTAAKLNKRPEETVRVGCVLSIGTGIAPPRETESVDLNGTVSSLFANVLAIKNLGIILVDQVTATEGAPVDRSRSWTHNLGAPFFRFSTPMSNDVQMDEKGDAEIVQMLWDCVEYTQRHRETIEEVVSLLRLSGKSEQRRHLWRSESTPPPDPANNLAKPT